MPRVRDAHPGSRSSTHVQALSAAISLNLLLP